MYELDESLVKQNAFEINFIKGNKNKTKTQMKNISIALPKDYIDAIEQLINIGLFPSRSEALRIAIKKLLKLDEIFKKALDIGFSSAIGKFMSDPIGKIEIIKRKTET